MRQTDASAEHGSGLRSWIQSEHTALLATFDFALTGVAAGDLLTIRPGSTENSIAWTIWHVARTEDVAVNAIIRGGPQVYDDGWRGRLAVDDPRIGTGSTHDEVEAFGRSINILELVGYWRVVHTATASWLAAVDIEVIDMVPEAARRIDELCEIVPEDGSWLLDLWRGRSTGYFLRSAVITHGYIHLGEMQTIMGRLGIAGL